LYVHILLMTFHQKLGMILETVAKIEMIGRNNVFLFGTIHLRRHHVQRGEGCPHVPMVKRSQLGLVTVHKDRKSPS
jgi:hypothetical protein